MPIHLLAVAVLTRCLLHYMLGKGLLSHSVQSVVMLLVAQRPICSMCLVTMYNHSLGLLMGISFQVSMHNHTPHLNCLGNSVGS